MDFGLNTLLDLYKRVTPALNSKRRELEKYKLDYIKNEDIWNYLVKRKWTSIQGLTLFDVVSDILNAANEEIDNYKKENIKLAGTKVVFNDTEIL